MQEVRTGFSWQHPRVEADSIQVLIDCKVTAAKDGMKSLRKGDGHVVVIRRITARKRRVPLELCEAGNDQIGSPFAGKAVIRPADHIFWKIEGHREFWSTYDEEILLNKW